MQSEQHDLLFESMNLREMGFAFRLISEIYLEEISRRSIPRPPSRKFYRLSPEIMGELATDVYHEHNRRAKPKVPFLPIREDFHPKRNQARRRLAAFPATRFGDLVSDLHHEFFRRYPEDAIPRAVSPHDLEWGHRFTTWIARLAATFKDLDEYRRLLSFSGSEAQSILDVFQMLLDSETTTESQFRRDLIVAMRRLSQKTNKYPRPFVLAGIQKTSSPVAAGTFADIYKGEFRGERVCLKTIRTYQFSLVQHMSKLFAKEAILWGQLSHPNILPFYGLCRIDSQLCFVSPWADNGNVDEYLRTYPDVNRVLLCSDTAAGIAYLHRAGIIHGDLKSVNVLVDGVGRACLADFGLSAVTDPNILHWSSHSSAASRGGTIRWQAPELHEPEPDDADPECDDAIHNSKFSDIYAWACVSYEIFTGRIPFFECSRDATVITKVNRGERPSRPLPSSRSWTEWGLTESIWELMNDCWERDPKARPHISTVISRLDTEKPVDLRSMGRWVGSATRLRNAVDSDYSLPSLQSFEYILATH